VTRSISHKYGSALRTAWWAYLVLLILPFMLFALVMVLHMAPGVSRRPLPGVNAWFLSTMAYLVVALPAALFYRRHLCIAYYRGELVAPQHYLAGMFTVWLTLEIGMIVAVVGCYLTASFMPGLIPAVAAFVVFITQWPTGRMMISRVGDSDDPEIYEMPR
jgi:hypothetical protein